MKRKKERFGSLEKEENKARRTAQVLTESVGWRVVIVHLAVSHASFRGRLKRASVRGEETSFRTTTPLSSPRDEPIRGPVPWDDDDKTACYTFVYRVAQAPVFSLLCFFFVLKKTETIIGEELDLWELFLFDLRVQSVEKPRRPCRRELLTRRAPGRHLGITPIQVKEVPTTRTVTRARDAERKDG